MTDHTPVFHPLKEQKIIFRGKEIATAELKDRRGYVSVRSFSEAFSLNQLVNFAV